ncbi:hypothetical protein BC834DRAFT_1042733 [Gloeopeniophorella convolvens]|nr:hypothetical protein BC834DRAFT_1042733 [Gloeopeniophorella convolvens]
MSRATMNPRAAKERFDLEAQRALVAIQEGSPGPDLVVGTPAEVAAEVYTPLEEKGNADAASNQVRAPAASHATAAQVLSNDTAAGAGEKSSSTSPLLDKDIMSNIEHNTTEDYDNDANGLWTLYGKEAKSHDEAIIQTWKDDMDGILIFAGLFSAVLTTFLGEVYQNLQADPAQENAFYGQQTVTILAQISQQIAGLAPQSPIPPAQLQQFPAFRPSQSDIRVNVYWFMSLVFSLTAALTATIVQQWVRDYMHIFQRYSHPLKSARVRQFLYEGAEGWYMPVVADAVPALVHISLFLFFIGLADFLFNINTTVATTTVTPIAICASLYLWSIVAPVINPQSPYQSSFSGMFWYISQKLKERTYTDRGSVGARKPVSAKMADGRMQLAMDKSEDRKMRDVRGIRWLIDSLTEDSELEPFVVGMPGAFKTKWGRDVWMRVLEPESSSEENESADQPLARPRATFLLTPPSLRQRIVPRAFRGARNTTDQQMLITLSPSPGREALLRELCRRVGRVVNYCVSYQFPTDSLEHRRPLGSIDAAMWLVLYANARLEWFGDPRTMRQALRLVGNNAVFNDKPGFDFVTGYPLYLRWGCLGVIAMQGVLKTTVVWGVAQDVILAYTQSYALPYDETEADGETEVALTNARRIDEHLNSAWKSLESLGHAFSSATWDPSTVQSTPVSSSQSALFGEFEGLIAEGARLRSVLDRPLEVFAGALDEKTDALSRDIPFGMKVPIRNPPLSHLKTTLGAGPLLRLWSDMISPGGLICVLSSVALGLRKAVVEGNTAEIQSQAGVLQALVAQLRPVLTHGHLVELQLWRIYDLREGGLGTALEAFFTQVTSFSTYSMRNLLSAELHQTIYVNTFRALISGWGPRDKSIGTQHVLLNLIYELFGVRNGFVSLGSCPEYLFDELLAFADQYFRGERGLHIDAAAEELRRCARDSDLRSRVLHALSQYN